MASTLQPGEVLALDALVTPTAKGIASRVLARSAAGNITLFAFDAGEELAEHTGAVCCARAHAVGVSRRDDCRS